MMVIAPRGVRQQVGRDHPRLHAMPVGEASPGGVPEALRLRTEGGGQRLAHFVQLGKEIALALNEALHPVGRRRRGVDRRFALRAPIGPAQPATIRIGAIETNQGVGDAGSVLRHLGHFMARDGQIAKQRIGQNFGQVPRAARVGVAGQTADIDVVGLGQTQQNLRGQGPLIALEMVEITGRYGQIFGHARLRQTQIAAQPFEPYAQKEFAFGRQGHEPVCHNVT